MTATRDPHEHDYMHELIQAAQAECSSSRWTPGAAERVARAAARIITTALKIGPVSAEQEADYLGDAIVAAVDEYDIWFDAEDVADRVARVAASVITDALTRVNAQSRLSPGWQPTGQRTQTGAQLIAAERQRQVDIEGHTAEHGAQHSLEDLVLAAGAYLGLNEWPWEPDSFKPLTGAGLPPHRRDLVRAGALIAAAIDRAGQNSASGTS